VVSIVFRAVGLSPLPTLARCPIIPFWIRGDRWVDCIPAGLVRTQYIDARGDRYQDGLTERQGALGALTDLRTPPFGLLRGYISNPNYHYLALPNGHLVGFREDAFPQLRQILDQLYITYLAGDVAPFTYGQDWVLELPSRSDFDNARPRLARVLLPWEALFRANLRQPALRHAGSWQESPMDGLYPRESGFHRVNVVQVCPMPSLLFGFATNDPWAIRDFTGFSTLFPA
jgi:hypothetical protein